MDRDRSPSHGPLLQQLGWFIRLRWVAACAVLMAAVLEWRNVLWYGHEAAFAIIGGAILAYNALLWLLLRRVATLPAGHGRRSALVTLAWIQVLLDLGCLTLLVLLTGALRSPLLGFFVFHMVFSSLLLTRPMAYGSASVAMLLLAGGLWLTGAWPVERPQAMVLLAWVVTLLMTVWLASAITRGLRRQRRRLIRQNRRIRAMSAAIRRQQQGLIQHEKMATAGRMAAGVAHEIANPLASMDGLLQLIERRPEKLKPESIATLREQVNRINRIVRQMTEFAHPGGGEPSTLGVNELVERAMAVVRYDPRWKRVKLAMELGEGIPPVCVVPEAIHQVIINLTINALDALEETPEPQLTLRTLQHGGHCLIQVADNGHGIRPEHRKRLFEPFFTTKPVGKGTGLGLSISYSLVRQQGGEIKLESGAGSGATFTVSLPLARTGAARTAHSITPGTGGSAH